MGDLSAAPFSIESSVLVGNRHIEIRSGFPLQNKPGAYILPHRLPITGSDVPGETVIVIESYGQPCLQCVSQRSGHGPLNTETIITNELIAGRNPGRKGIGRLGGGDVDGAGGSVLADQSALGAFQHLDALNVQKGCAAHAAATIEESVHHHAHCLLKAHVDAGTHAAQKHIIATGDRLADGQVRHGGRQILQAGDSACAQALPGNRGDGNGYIAQALLALLRRYDNLLKRRSARLRLLPLRIYRRECERGC